MELGCLTTNQTQPGQRQKEPACVVPNDITIFKKDEKNNLKKACSPVE
jgi:hypothetical protein